MENVIHINFTLIVSAHNDHTNAHTHAKSNTITVALLCRCSSQNDVILSPVVCHCRPSIILLQSPLFVRKFIQKVSRTVALACLKTLKYYNSVLFAEHHYLKSSITNAFHYAWCNRRNGHVRGIGLWQIYPCLQSHEPNVIPVRSINDQLTKVAIVYTCFFLKLPQ